MTEEEWKERLNGERTTVRLQRQELETKGRHIASLEKQVQDLRTRLDQKETEFAQTEAKWNERKRELKKKVREVEDINIQFEEDVKYYDQELSALKSQAQNQLESNNTINTRLEKYKRKIADLEKNNQLLLIQFEDFELERVEKNEMLEERDRTISNLNKLIEGLEEKNQQQKEEIRKLHESWGASGKRASSSSKKTIFNKKNNMTQRSLPVSMIQQQKLSTQSTSTSTHSSDLDNIIPTRRSNQRISAPQPRYPLLNAKALLSRASSPVADTVRLSRTTHSPASTLQSSRYFDNVNNNINVNNQQQQVEEEYEDEEGYKEEEMEEQQYYSSSSTVLQDALTESRASKIDSSDAFVTTVVQDVKVKQEKSLGRTAAKRSIQHDIDSTRIQKKRFIDAAAAPSVSSVTIEEVNTSDLPRNLPRESSPIYFDEVATHLAAAATAQEQQAVPDDSADKENSALNENEPVAPPSQRIEYSVSINKGEEEEESSNVINLFMTPSPPPQRNQSFTSSPPRQEPPLRQSLSDTTNFTTTSSAGTSATAKEKNNKILSTSASSTATTATTTTSNSKKNKKPVSLNTTTVNNLIPNISNAASTSTSRNINHTSTRHSHGRGETCMACNKFYNSGNMINPENNQVLTPKDRIQLHSRHKTKPGRATTPPHFWSIDNFSFSPEEPKRN